MSTLFTRNAALVIEITESTAHLAGDNRSLDVALERDGSGALAAASVDSLRNAIKMFALPQGAQAFCLLPARGISIRRIALPAASKEEIERLLPLQIDAQFPLGADELSWGYSVLPAQNGANGKPLKDLLVAAIRKEALRQYREIISSAGLSPVFSVAALTREGACPSRPPHFGLLEIGAQNSELVTFDERGPTTLRVVNLNSNAAASPEPMEAALRSNGAIEKLFVAGKSSALWTARFAPQIPAESLELPTGQSTAIAGLRKLLATSTEPLLLHERAESVSVTRQASQWTWAIAAGILLLMYFGLRYAEPIVQNKRLNKSIAELQTRRGKLPKVDREAAFLNYIHTNQPNYLDVVAALSTATAPGMKLDALSISRRGEISLRGSAQGGQAATGLRSKMLDSGFFDNVVIDEQTPVQNGQQMNFRMTAQLRPEGDRKPPRPAETKGSTNKPPVIAKTNTPTASPSPAPPQIAQPPTQGVPQ